MRPPAQARFGSVCERLFGTTNSQFIHNLRGNTQITRNVRQVTKSNEPTGQARWPLGRLYDYLSSFLFEIYDTIEHPALGQTPAGGMSQGSPKHRHSFEQDDSLRSGFLVGDASNNSAGHSERVTGTRGHYQPRVLLG